MQTLRASDALDVRAMRSLVERFPERYPALFESVARNPVNGRKSILFAMPGEPIVARPGLSFFDDLDAAHRGGAGFGHLVYLGYEMLKQIEAVDVPASPALLPDGIAIPIQAAVEIDHSTASVAIRCAPADEAVVRAAIEDDVRECLRHDRRPAQPQALSIEEEDPDRFLGAVRATKELIAAGDVYQANLSREWRARIGRAAGAVDLYHSLTLANPAPFAGIFRWESAAVISSSPERLLRRRGAVLESRPIAGTRPRTGADDAVIAELLADEKERAEHIMLVDLIRNDLGKVARYGSVEVDELLTIESYAHVHHIVSNVRAVAGPGTTPGRALAAVFPGGTITGCPKVRCMEIIAEMEGAGRGAYTGSLGYVTAAGDMDFNILIRTMVYEQGRVAFRTGAGIVSDSVPERELEETRAKAR